MKRRFVILLILLCGLVSFTSAQDYYFSIPKYTVDVYIQKDASIDIDYNITFAPLSGYHSVDIVDIGFPTTAYKLNSIQASLDGHEIPRSSIKTSTVVDIGVEIHLGSHTIMPGDQGTLFIHGNKVRYEPTNNKSVSGRATKVDIKANKIEAPRVTIAGRINTVKKGK